MNGKRFFTIALLMSRIATADPTETTRLSWSPYDFLKEGYRNAPWVKDPFYPESGIFEVSGIISNEMAFINGQWRHPGDWLNGYLVKEISPKGVVLTRNAEILIVKMKQ